MCREQGLGNPVIPGNRKIKKGRHSHRRSGGNIKNRQHPGLVALIHNQDKKRREKAKRAGAEPHKQKIFSSILTGGRPGRHKRRLPSTLTQAAYHSLAS